MSKPARRRSRRSVHGVNSRVPIEHLGSVIEIHPNDKRKGFSLAISGDTRQESIDLQCRDSLHRVLLHPGRVACDIPRDFEVDSAFTVLPDSHRAQVCIEKTQTCGPELHIGDAAPASNPQ
jgi:hypothetical protein